MSMNELISVIITTYARPNTLPRAINSVLKQTYDNIEIIIVDDNDDMNIREEVKKLIVSFNDSRIKLICNNINFGGALSRNEGIKAARGKYIAFLDDDDEYLPEKLKEQYKLFAESDDIKLALVYGYCREIGSGNHVREYRYDFTGNCIYEAMLDCIAATSQWMCKKSALVDVDMFSDVPCKQDSTVIIKLLVSGFTVDRVSKFLSIYHTDEIVRISSKNHRKRIIGEEKLRQLCRENYHLISSKQIKEVEYSFACRLAEHYLALNQKEDFKKCFLLILKHPIRKKSLAVYKHLFEMKWDT